MVMLIVEAVRFGGPQVLAARQAPDPVAGPGQVVVRTSAADVVFDGAGGPLGRSAFDVIAVGGRFSAHGTSDGGFAPHLLSLDLSV
jgi:NADPH:quinone reductase-like Zn-dependent oxidoreductase